MTAKGFPLSLDGRAPASFVDHLRRLAQTHGEEAAITFLSTDDSAAAVASYAMLDERARTIAGALQACAASGERVVLMLETSLAYVTAFFGGLYAGVVPVPAFPPEARRTQHTARLRAILRDAAPTVLLVHAGGEEAARALLAEEHLDGAVRVLAVESIGSETGRVWRPRAVLPDDLAMLQYTSGSTSEPKGVMVSHGNLIANARVMHLALSPREGDCGVSWLPLHHDMGLMSGLLQPIFSGIPLVLMPPQLFLARPVRWLEAISRFRGSFSGGPDFAYRLCVDRVGEAAMAGFDLSCWKLAFSGSETVRADTLRAFAAKFEAAGFDARAFYPCYGQAEATLFVSGGTRGDGMRETRFDAQELKRGIAIPVPESGTGVVACGHAKPGHAITIVDPETGVTLPNGRIGEIWTAGPVVTQGYWCKPEATAETFVEHEGRRFLRTGDLGFLHEGQLYIAGRRKDMIIIRGQNLYPQDIEQTLETELDVLRSGRIAAFAVEHDGGEGIGIAAEISRGVQKLTQPETLARLIGETVSAAFFEPARVIVLLNPGGLPRTSSGKLQRSATRQGWMDGTLDAYAVIVDGVLEGRSEAAVPEAFTPTQQQLAAIWRVVLGREGLALDDSFFMLGGNSIEAVQVLTRIEEVFGLALEPAALFAAPTLRGLAAAIDEARREGRPAMAPAITAGDGTAAGLSYAQRRMWFLRELGGDGAVQHIAGGLRLGGMLDRAALEAALGGLARRHDGLRTVFRRLPDGEAEPVVREAADVPLAFEDLSGLPDADRQARLDALSASEACAPLDLEAGPLLRVTLVRLAPDRHELLLTMHHIVSDGWSVRILLGELLQLYAAACRGETAKLPELPIRYADYAAWQRNLLDAGGLEPQLAFWRETLGEAAVPPIALPFDRPRPAVQSHRGGKLSFALDAELAARLRQLAASRNVTLVTVLLAAFNALLWRISGTAELRVGLPVAGRNRRETESIVGLFVNTLVLRCQVDGAAGFTGLIGQVRDRLIAAQANQDLPFEMLVEALSPDRDLSHSPLVQVMYNHQPLALGALPAAAGLTVDAFARDGGGQQFDLVLETEETAAGSLSASFGYASDLFHHATIARMAGHFTTLLRCVAADPDARLDSIELVTADELAALSTPCPVAGGTAEQPVHRLISAQAARRPDAPAVICGDATLSFAALEAQANRLAWHLLRRGIGPEDRIGVMMERSPAQITALLGVLKAGAAFLPLDSQHPPARLAQMLTDSGARLVLTETGLAAPGGVPVLNLDTLDLSEESPAAPDIAIHPEQLAYLIYTSGSTGLPKAVAVAHGPLSRHCQATAEFYEMDERSRELHVLSFAFDGAHERWITPLILGGSIVMRGPELWDAGDTLAAMARHKVTNAGFPAAYLQQVARAAADDAAPPPKLRMVSFGGEAMPRGGFELIKRALKPELLINGYGPTEAVISPLAWKAAATQGFEGAYAPIGRAIGRRRAYILDASLNPVPQGVAGELYIGGDIARGYHARPGLTAERFLPDPFAGGGARMLRTGDRVRLLADGNVEYLGRLDAQMKLRGFRIEPGEIEARLIDHETVSAAAIALHETPSGPRLTGYVVPAPGAAPDPATLRASLARALPAYMVPARIQVIAAIPLTPTGKIDRAALPIPPDEDAGQLTPPATELEAELAEIWRQTLKIPQIGTNQNFFEIGGDSILSLQIVARARRAGMVIAPGDLFRHQTIAELATVVRPTQKAAEISADPGGPAPLTPIQSWFFAEPIPNHAHWNQRLVLVPHAPLNAETLNQALQHLVEHHEALRLRFWREDGVWRQEPIPPSRAAGRLWMRTVASEVDLVRHIDEADRSLDLAAGQLLRAVLATLQDGSQRLVLTIHHLAVDGVSWRILIEDLETAYRQLASGLLPSLPPSTASFPHWARHLAEAAASADEAEYWTRLAAGIAPLPRDNPAGANHREHARRIVAHLPAAATNQLLTSSSAAYRTRPDELMLTALARAVSRWAGKPEVLIDLETHGRDLPDAALDVSRTVGWFTTVFPVRLAGHGDIARALKSVKEAVRRTPGNGAGYGLLRHLGTRETRTRLAQLPHAEIAFNYLGRVDAASSGLFSAAADSMELSTDATAPLGPLITIDAFAAAEGLSFRWTYSGEIYRAETIEALASSMLDELTAIVAHCAGDTVAGATPSDFPEAGLTQTQLDRLDLPWRQIEDMHRLTPLQQGMLFHGLYAPEENAYVNQLRLTIHGLELPRFIAAWRAVLARHGTLRSGFIRHDDLDAPRQVIFRTAELPVREEDWRGRAATADDLDTFAAAERRGFDLAQPPLMRLAFIRTGETSHHMVWTCHHLLLDGWSNALLLAEVLKLYAEPGAKLPPATFRFRDYVTWLEARDSIADERFWRETLRGLEEPTLISAAFRGEPGASGNATRMTVLDADRMARFTAFARRERVTLNMLIQAAWLLTLKRYTAADMLCFGMTVAGRPAELPGIESALGLFINTVPVVASVKSSRSVGEWLRALQDQAILLREHEFAPLVDIQRWAGKGGRALFDSLLVFENYPVDAALRSGEIGGLRFDKPISEETTNYPLTLSIFSGDHAGLQWSFARSSFTADEIAGIERQFIHMLESLTADAGVPIGALAVALPEEMQAARAPAAARRSFDAAPVHQRFAEQARLRPNSIALTLGEDSLTYGALESHANRLANCLIAAGVQPGGFVGLAAERSFELIAGILAILKAGAAYVPLDPAYPLERLAFMAEDARLSALLTTADLASSLARDDMPVIALDEAASAEYPDEAPDVGVFPQSPAYVIYTSGSTGTPKGVVVSHGNVARLFTATQDWFGFGPGDVWTLFHSYAFDFSVWEMFGALCHGGRLVIVPHLVSRSPDEFLRLLVAERVTVLNQTPSAFRQLMRAATEAAGKPGIALRTIVFGGEALEVAALRPWFERFGDTAPRLVNMYGITETTVHVTWRPISMADLDGGAKSPIGEPVPDLTLYVLDTALNPAPPGVAGELYVGGSGLASGYFGRPGLTAERFLPDPFGGRGGRLYRTGDKAMRLADGAVEYLGRLDAQVKIRGFRIELGEIETRLLAEPGIREAVVIVRDDGGGGPQLLAYVVAAGDIELDALKASLRRQLPDYMVPAQIIPIPAVPLTENGKLDRRALPLPRASAAGMEPPQTEAERTLAGIWRDVLGVEGVGLGDNFFDLGGHSLLAVQVHLQIGREFGIELPLRTLFEARGLRELAEAVDGLRTENSAHARTIGEMAALMDELEG